jgi:hypothetical protein
MVDASISDGVGGTKKRTTTCRNTQKIGDTLFKCDLRALDRKHYEQNAPYYTHREKGRVIKDGKSVAYEVWWWDIPSEVIRAS